MSLDCEVSEGVYKWEKILRTSIRLWHATGKGTNDDMFKAIERRVGKDLADVYSGEKRLDDVIVSKDEDTEAAMDWREDDAYRNIFPQQRMVEFPGGPEWRIPNPWTIISDAAANRTHGSVDLRDSDDTTSDSGDSVRTPTR